MYPGTYIYPPGHVCTRGHVYYLFCTRVWLSLSLHDMDMIWVLIYYHSLFLVLFFGWCFECICNNYVFVFFWVKINRLIIHLKKICCMIHHSLIRGILIQSCSAGAKNNHQLCILSSTIQWCYPKYWKLFCHKSKILKFWFLTL